jgi:multidrug efflux pump subunit AcrA (membrane-fusion protein)
MPRLNFLTIIPGLLLAFPLAANEEQAGLLFTGEVFSRQAQEIFVPLTNNWQARISTMAPEGVQVNKGDLVVVFDGSEAARQLEQQQDTQRTEQAKTERDIARLEQQLSAAVFELEQAEIELELASLKADIPEGLIGGLDFAEYQLARERAVTAVENARKKHEDLLKQTEERHRQAELDREKAELQLGLWNEMLESFSVYARQPGFMIYGKHPWNRTKFQEGDTVRTSFRIAQVADTKDLAVKIWINSIDRPRVKAGSAVRVMLDALPDVTLNGRLDAISESGERRYEWGGALYYEAVVVFESTELPELLPGMSALVQPL